MKQPLVNEKVSRCPSPSSPIQQRKQHVLKFYGLFFLYLSFMPQETPRAEKMLKKVESKENDFEAKAPKRD